MSLYDPIHGSPPGSSVPEILQARRLKWAAISFSGMAYRVSLFSIRIYVGLWFGISLQLTQFSSIQLLSHVQLLATPWTVARQASLSFTNSWRLFKLMSIDSMMAIQLFHPLLSPSPPAFSLSQHQGLFQWVSSIRWPKYWSFSFSISPSNEYSGLISFRMDWFDLLAVQGTLKSLLQHQSSKASIVRPSAFFIVQLSHPYMTTGKPAALTRLQLTTKYEI